MKLNTIMSPYSILVRALLSEKQSETKEKKKKILFLALLYIYCVALSG